MIGQGRKRSFRDRGLFLAVQRSTKYLDQEAISGVPSLPKRIRVAVWRVAALLSLVPRKEVRKRKIRIQGLALMMCQFRRKGEVVECTGGGFSAPDISWRILIKIIHRQILIREFVCGQVKGGLFPDQTDFAIRVMIIPAQALMA
jgi:hypothetical protein